MKKKFTFAALAMVLACALGLAGCGAKGTIGSTMDDETGAYIVEAEDAGKDSGVGTSGGIEVKEYQTLVVSSELTSGKVKVRITNWESTDDGALVDEEISGTTINDYQIEPGDYGISVTSMENGTTGKVTVVAVDAIEFNKQGRNLEATLAAMKANEAAAAAAPTEAVPTEATYEINYGESAVYTQEDMDAAINVIMNEFNGWQGCTMKSISFTDDETCANNLEYCNEIRQEDMPVFDQAIVFKTNFHSPSVEESEGTAWEPDTDYNDYEWILGRAEGGEWHLVTWGY